ncbi:Uncharacterized protein GBIM_18324 [Gryllus bimaculatus]|nr:Uncharacterized protein GBIM_18324 [Gryllus bimaculatus]
METEEITKLVDGIYKNILEKFNPGARQLINAGKAYLKALHDERSKNVVSKIISYSLTPILQHSALLNLWTYISIIFKEKEQKMWTKENGLNACGQTFFKT